MTIANAEAAADIEAAADVGTIVVTGTGTDVGKTIATAALAALARSRGVDVGICKPVQTGLAPGEPGDAEEAARLSGVSRVVDLFVAEGGFHVQRGVAPAVVVPVDERHDLDACLGDVAEPVLVEQLALERGEERFGH